MIILGRKLNTVYREAAKDDGVLEGGQKPNEDWKNDPRLDENGNPIENPKQEEPAKEEPNEQPKDEPEEKEAESFDFSTPVVEQVSKMLEDAGLDPSKVAEEVTKNDGKLTPALLKSLVEKHGEAVAALIADQLKTFHKATKDKANERDKVVFTHLEEAFKDVTDQSGDKTWNELSTWAKDNIPNEERKEINKLLSQGGLASKYALDDLVNRFKTSNSFTQEAQLIEGDNQHNHNGIIPMSRADYNRELDALLAKGHVYGQSNEIAKLDARRSAGMARGI